MPHHLRQSAAPSTRAWPARLPTAAAWPFFAAWAVFWWSLKRHICECYRLPAESAGPPPFAWLADAPKAKLQADAYGRWRWRD